MNFERIIDTSNDIGHNRSELGIFLKLQEEVGELATELNIAYGMIGKEPGPDGIIGEAVDVLITIVDFLNLQAESQEVIAATVERKLAKWKGKHGL